MFSEPRMVFGDNILSDVRLSSTVGGGVYQLRSDPSFGVQILRYSFAGGAIHLLRHSSGRDVALDLRVAAPSLDTRLERGLFVSWNKMLNGRPGRIAFVPLRDLDSLP